MHALERKQGGSCPQGASQSCASAAMEKKQESRLQTRSNGRRRQVAHRALLSHIPPQPWRKGDGRASQGVHGVRAEKAAVASVQGFPPSPVVYFVFLVAINHPQLPIHLPSTFHQFHPFHTLLCTHSPTLFHPLPQAASSVAMHVARAVWQL